MSQLEEYEDLIPDYVAGRLNAEQHSAIEKALQTDAGLREAVEATRMIASGMAVHDAVLGEHIESELLIRYADDSDSLDYEQRQRVVSHLESCTECRQELTMCAAAGEPVEAHAGLLSTLVNWLVTPRLVMRPISAMVAAGLVVAVTLSFIMYSGSKLPPRADVRLVPVSRDLVAPNRLELDRRVPITNLEFAIPSRSSCSYEVQLCDSLGRPQIIRTDNPAQDAQGLAVPTNFFENGRYRLRVIEISPDSNREEIATFDFSVRLVNE